VLFWPGISAQIVVPVTHVMRPPIAFGNVVFSWSQIQCRLPSRPVCHATNKSPQVRGRVLPALLGLCRGTAFVRSAICPAFAAAASWGIGSVCRRPQSQRCSVSVARRAPAVQSGVADTLSDSARPARGRTWSYWLHRGIQPLSVARYGFIVKKSGQRHPGAKAGQLSPINPPPRSTVSRGIGIATRSWVVSRTAFFSASGIPPPA
jgi:hypothetical protein